MIWINRIFFLLFLNSISGGLAYVIWKILSLVLEKYGMISTAYRLLKIVVVFFFLPVAYFFLNMKPLYDDTYMGFMPKMGLAIKVAYLAWFLGMVVFMIIYCIRYRVFMLMSVYSTKVIDPRVRRIFREVCEEEGISEKEMKRIRLMENPAFPTACTSGVLFPKVVLSDDVMESSDHEIRIILAHELFHMCNRDLLIKQIAFLILLLNWWNYAAYCLIRDINEWSECNCDRHVIFGYLDGKMQPYYDMMYNYISSQNFLVALHVAQYNHHKSMKRRIERMKKYRAGKKLVGVVMALVLLAGSSVSVFAASEIVADVCEDKYAPGGIEAEYVDETATMIGDNDDLEIYTMTAEEMDALLEAEGGSISQDYSRASGTFNWTIPGVTIRATSAFYCSASTITVSADVSPKYAWVGIIDPDGNFHYVKGTGAIYKTFPLSQKGAYQVFVKNINATEITALGHYF